MDRLWSQPPDTTPLDYVFHTTPFLYVVTKQSLQWCRPEKRGPVTLDSTATASHSPAIVSLRSWVPGANMSVPPTWDPTTRAPSIFTCSTWSLHFMWSNPLTSGVAKPPGLKMLIQACPFYSWKIIRPSAFKRICSQHFLKGACWSLKESMGNSFQLYIMRHSGDYGAITCPLSS